MCCRCPASTRGRLTGWQRWANTKQSPLCRFFFGSSFRPMHTIDMSGKLNAPSVCVSRSVCSIGVCAYSLNDSCSCFVRGAVCAYACVVMSLRNINYKHSANAWKTKWRLFNSICDQSKASHGTHVRLCGRRSTFPMKIHRCHIIDSIAQLVICIAKQLSRWKMLYVIEFVSVLCKDSPNWCGS